jgi:hypothetical protein
MTKIKKRRIRYDRILIVLIIIVGSFFLIRSLSKKELKDRFKMKKINPWEANDLAGDYEERGFHPTKWEEVTEFDEEGYVI